jgi:glycine cleavage system H protein
VNTSPYGDAWLIKVKVADPSQLKSLMDPNAYDDFANAEGH